MNIEEAKIITEVTKEYR